MKIKRIFQVKTGFWARTVENNIGWPIFMKINMGKEVFCNIEFIFILVLQLTRRMKVQDE